MKFLSSINGKLSFQLWKGLLTYSLFQDEIEIYHVKGFSIQDVETGDISVEWDEFGTADDDLEGCALGGEMTSSAQGTY